MDNIYTVQCGLLQIVLKLIFNLGVSVCLAPYEVFVCFVLLGMFVCLTP